VKHVSCLRNFIVWYSSCLKVIFSMYGMMFLSFQSYICVLNIFYPNMLKYFSFSIVTFPEQCVQVFNKFAIIVERQCSSQASAMWFCPWLGFGLVHKIVKSDLMFVKAGCTSVCPHGRPLLPLDRFSWNLIFEYFFLICWENSSLLNCDKNNRYFTWRPTYIFYHILLNYS
jgi:hypothetical protein